LVLDTDGVRPIVVEERGCEVENDWGQRVMVNDGWELWEKKVHRYCRLERFRGVLGELIGMRGKVSLEVIEECEWLLEFDGGNVWDVVRGYLKQNGLRQYYNRIPQIIFRLGYKVLEGYSYEKYMWMMEDFKKMHERFDREVKGEEGVVYFPNLRYICFRLMEKYGVRYTFHVPMVRTMRKRPRLDKIWDRLNKDL